MSTGLGSGDAASCGHPNPVWSADSQLWNEVMCGDRDEEAAGVLCPACFADRADTYFADKRWRITGWRFIPEWSRPDAAPNAKEEGRG